MPACYVPAADAELLRAHRVSLPERSIGASPPRPRSLELVEDARAVPRSLRTAAPPVGSRIELRYRSRALPDMVFLLAGGAPTGIACVAGAAMFAARAPLVAFLGPGLFLAVGAALLFHALAPALARTTIRIEDGTLTARRRGLRWPRTVTIDLSRVRWLHARAVGSGFTLAAHVDGRAIDLVPDLTHPDEVRYLEHILGARVGAKSRT